jgi:radical SAM superfamily enzyme YgiQ (UPF0313 family)
MLRIVMREAAAEADRGSVGCAYVTAAAARAGYSIATEQLGEYDVELVSVHHCTDFLRLARMERWAPLRIVGGHPCASNPRPAIPYADAICVGEGESWIVEALDRIADSGMDGLAGLRSTIVTSRWDGEIPQAAAEAEVPKNPPYLNRAAQGHDRVWYLEMARGCPHRCAYCELGHTLPYRMQNTDWLLQQIAGIDRRQSSKVTLFAPDEASHPGYGKILDALARHRLITSFGSMRLDRLMARPLRLPRNMLIRVGVDGLTEATRVRVGKRLTDETIVDYFTTMSNMGYSNFKIFMIFGYPWEKLDDFNDFELLFHRVAEIPRCVNAHVRVKFTPLIPHPGTPLAGVEARYDERMVARICAWLAAGKYPRRNPGWYFRSDGLMSRESWQLQCALTAGDEGVCGRILSTREPQIKGG